ncbi:MAG: Uma2 family endonuclease [Acidobacteria bacterium]|nr:Uma2 family endonuclease [Acidobacteriota bacterium]
MSALRKEKLYTPEQYLELERAAEERHEYLDGQIYLMSGGSPKHSTICVNVSGELRFQLKGKPCQVFEANMKVGTSTSSLFSYPDVSVVCGEPAIHDKHRDVLTNPKVIIEVLSPSTERFDRGKKFARYQRFDSFTDYVLIAQDEPRVEHFARQANGTWVLTVATTLKSKIQIASIACALQLAEVYDRIEFAEEPPVKKSAKTAKPKKTNKQRAKA